MEGRRARYEAEYRLRNRNGHYIGVHDRGRVCEYAPDGQPRRLVGMVQDITERKALELRLQNLAAFDTLTGLSSRLEGSTFLASQADLCQRLSLPMGLAFLDIDHFKAVNDRHGHLAGDDVLRRVGRAVQGAVRSSDRVCRWGGEEFLVIAPDTTLAQMTDLAEKLRLTVGAAMAGQDPAVTISLGVAAAEGSAIDVTALIARADAALYRAKQAGRNRVEVGAEL